MMSDAEKVSLVQAMTGETDANMVSAYLAMAAETIRNYVDPYAVMTADDVMSRYGSVQIRAAAYFLNKRGAEGQNQHSENGILRSYEAADLPPSLLRELTPVCGVAK